MSRECSELNAIENIYETYCEKHGVNPDLEDLLNYVLWQKAEDDFGAQGGYE